jgi:type IV secretory pathway VirB10-like protein
MNEPVELDQAARDVIAAGREGALPNEFVAERLRRSVRRVLSGSVPPGRSRTRSVAILVAFGAAALGGALYANQLSGEAEKNNAPMPAPVKPIAKPPSPTIPTPAPTPESTAFVPAPQAPTSRAEPQRPSRSQQLSAEIEHLARANALVNAGDGRGALALLDEYDRKFRPSILAEERAAASVLALCAAGRTGEARAAAERFSRRWQRSPLLSRIARSCAGSE